jgi:regulator of microtubule dynamics protein 3
MLKLFIVLLFISSPLFASHQDDKSEILFFKQAEKLHQEKKWSEALVILKNLLKNDSSNVEYLWRTSFIYSKIGVDQKTESLKQQWYKTAAYLGKRAITQHPQNSNAHYAYAVALGRMTEFASNKTKIDNAKLIKSEAELTIKLDPKNAGAYHILGRWHREIAGFNIFERTMIKAIFGALPGGTYEESIKYFEKAILLEPLNGIHYYELAQTYLARDNSNDKQNAKNWLSKATQIQIKNKDDIENKNKCEALLKEI